MTFDNLKKINIVNATNDNYNYYFATLFNRISNLLDFGNVPQNININYLKKCLYLTGQVTFFKRNGNLYVANCARGGEIDEYYLPTKMILANPILGSADMTIDVDCVPVWLTTADSLDYSDCTPSPIFGLISKTAKLLAECLTSLNIAQINTRASYLVTADTNSAKTSAEIVLKSIYKGEPYKVVNGDLISQIKAMPLTTDYTVKSLQELRELHQYYIASFYRAIGVNSTINQKKERLITSEMNADSEPLVINIADIIDNVSNGIDKVNNMFGTDITVNLSAEWVTILNAKSDTESALSSVESKDDKEVGEN